jgi:phage terminase small subunit
VTRTKRAYPTEMQMMAINAYFENGFKKNEAMRTAGYAESTCKTFTGKVFSNPVCVAEIERRMAKRAKKHDLSVDWLIKQFMKRALSGEVFAKFRKVAGDGSLYYDFRGATEEELALVQELQVEFMKSGRGKGAIDVTKFRIKEPDVHAALMALGRHMGIFDDRLDITGGDEISRIQAGRDRAAKAKSGESDPDTIH